MLVNKINFYTGDFLYKLISKLIYQQKTIFADYYYIYPST